MSEDRCQPHKANLSNAGDAAVYIPISTKQLGSTWHVLSKVCLHHLASCVAELQRCACPQLIMNAHMC